MQFLFEFHGTITIEGSNRQGEAELGEHVTTTATEATEHDDGCDVVDLKVGVISSVAQTLQNPHVELVCASFLHHCEHVIRHNELFAEQLGVASQFVQLLADMQGSITPHEVDEELAPGRNCVKVSQ